MFAWLRDAIAQRNDRLERLYGRVSIVFLFRLGQLLVGDQAGGLFLGIIAFRSELPAVLEALERPSVVIVFGQPLRQSKDVFVERDVGGLDGLGTVWHGRTPSRNNRDAAVGENCNFCR